MLSDTFCRGAQDAQGGHVRGGFVHNHIEETWCASRALSRKFDSPPRSNE